MPVVLGQYFPIGGPWACRKFSKWSVIVNSLGNTVLGDCRFIIVLVRFSSVSGRSSFIPAVIVNEREFVLVFCLAAVVFVVIHFSPGAVDVLITANDVESLIVYSLLLFPLTHPTSIL